MTRLIVKGRHLLLNDHLKAYVEAKLLRPAAKWIDGPSVTLEVELSDLFGPKGGQHKQCEVNMMLPRGRILRIEEVSDDLYTAIETASGRLVHALERLKGKRLTEGRHPKKYYTANRLNLAELPRSQE